MGLPSLFSVIWLFAEAAAEAPAAADKAPAAGSLLQMLTPMIAIFFLFYLLILRPQQRKQADQKTLLESVKKNDRIVTIGGIYGVVTNVQRDSDRVTIKIDESTNTKIDITFGAIARVIVEDQKGVAEKS